MNSIKINTKLFRKNNKLHKQLSDYALSIYIALKINEYKYLNTSDIYKILSNNQYKHNREILTKQTPKAVLELEYLGLIKVIKQTTKYNYEIQLLEQKEDIENYFWVDIKDIYKIFSEKQPYKILGYYLCLVSTINTKTKIGFMCNNSISNRLNYSKRTIINKNNKLKNLNLIVFKERKGDNNIQKSNLYALEKNKSYLNLFKKIEIDENTTIEFEDKFKDLIVAKNSF